MSDATTIHETNYTVIDGGIVPIKAWINGVALEQEARKQLLNVAQLPFVYKWVAVMPDVHWGMGATVGSVIPTVGAIVPAAVGVDIGCGMIAAKTTLKAKHLPDDLRPLRHAIEKAVPHGRTNNGGKGDKGAWQDIPRTQQSAWDKLLPSYEQVLARHPRLDKGHVNTINHLGTLGTGNHFIEICLDEEDNVWIMLHSGSRGIGNRIGTYFIELAKQDMERQQTHLPDKDLAYLREGSQYFDDYVLAVGWAQDFARLNRDLMLRAVVKAMQTCKGIREFDISDEVINCHHNYVQRETHFDQEIPGSMGTGSFIVRGKGNAESFESCSHGAGRAMSRGEAKRKFSVEDHIKATAGVECRKDEDVIDETPGAYKPIGAVIEAQSDLIDVVHRLKQVVCVKG
jgi:tRNA-splicing ligase RtcB (3'-phosphate/5'-hydroxy nucleic acid ligase)